jgi:hypothetical protein
MPIAKGKVPSRNPPEVILRQAASRRQSLPSSREFQREFAGQVECTGAATRDFTESGGAVLANPTTV